MKFPHQKHESYRYKLPLKKLSCLDILCLVRYNFATSKMNILRKIAQNLKNITILHFMTTFDKVTYKTETSFMLQRCLSPLWKLEKSMINIKT